MLLPAALFFSKHKQQRKWYSGQEPDWWASAQDNYWPSITIHPYPVRIKFEFYESDRSEWNCSYNIEFIVWEHRCKINRISQGLSSYVWSMSNLNIWKAITAEELFSCSQTRLHVRRTSHILTFLLTGIRKTSEQTKTVSVFR